jgi:hypothetical protein
LRWQVLGVPPLFLCRIQRRDGALGVTDRGQFDEELADAVRNNTKRYEELFALVIDEIKMPPTVEVGKNTRALSMGVHPTDHAADRSLRSSSRSSWSARCSTSPSSSVHCWRSTRPPRPVSGGWWSDALTRTQTDRQSHAVSCLLTRVTGETAQAARFYPLSLQRRL